jgi:P-aminobenzoate N-oxygenase AurF
VSRIHVLEEARHMTFAREEVERAVPRMGRTELAFHRTMVAQTAFMVARTLVNPRVYAELGLEPSAAKKAAFTNPHYRDTMAWMGERVVGFLEEQDLIGPVQRRVWQRSLLMPA